MIQENLSFGEILSGREPAKSFLKLKDAKHIMVKRDDALIKIFYIENVIENIGIYKKNSNRDYSHVFYLFWKTI